MLLWQTKLLGIGLAVLLLFGCYFWAGHRAVENYKSQIAVEQAKADKEQQDKYNNLAADYELLKANRKVVYKTLTSTVERIVKEPAYQVPCIPQEGVEVANKALAGGASNELF